LQTLYQLRYITLHYITLLNLKTVRHVKCLRQMRWQGMWHVYGGGRVADWM